MNILVVMHSALVPSGVIGECIIDRDGMYTVVMPQDGDPLPGGAQDFDGMIILGGPMSAADDAAYPAFQPLLKLIRDFDDEHKPVLGVCLGAQLIARAYNESVFSLNEMELGFKPVQPTRDALYDPLLYDVRQEQFMMQWHNDTFDIPDEAVLLMTGPDCPNQAYRIGSGVYSFQFHLEVTPDIIRAWVRNPGFEVAERFSPILRDLDNQIARHMKGSFLFARKVVNRWLDLVEMSRDGAKQA